ncbi:MAG: glycosyltransferase [Actinomycetota bacterium]
MSPDTDLRLQRPTWDPSRNEGTLRLARILALVNGPLALWYVSWLLEPGRSAHPILYVMLVAAELFNMAQAAGFWWTIRATRRHRPAPAGGVSAAVDVLIPTYNEPVEVVEPTLAAALRIRHPDLNVVLLDDGGRPEMERLAGRYGVRYLHRTERHGAKAGAINAALEKTGAPFVAVFDCDHVPDARFLEATLTHFADEKVAFVQTPQYYANGRTGGVASASWSQQSLFFGPIATGRDALGAMFCCGTNVVFRRAALQAVGGFPTESLTEDFELSLALQEEGWQTRYVPEVLASGLGPEDMASYVSQQLRWARGCLSAAPRILGAHLPFRVKLNYLLSAGFWLTGWTVLVYVSFPIVRILTGEQPVTVASPDQFLVHWAPYFAASLATVALSARGSYTFSAFAVMSANFWIHIQATILVLLRRRGTFAVTPKESAGGRQLRPVAVPLAVCTLLGGVAAYGLVRDQSPATMNNVAFALLHITVLLSGAWPALQGRPSPQEAPSAAAVEAA